MARVLAQLAAWLEGVPLGSASFFLNEPKFWNELERLMWLVLCNRWVCYDTFELKAYAYRFLESRATADKLRRLFESYLEICISLMRVDRSRLRTTEDLLSEQDFISLRHLPALVYLLRSDSHPWTSFGVSSMARGFSRSVHAVARDLRRVFLECKHHGVVLNLLLAAQGRSRPSAYLQIASSVFEIMLGYSDSPPQFICHSRQDFYPTLLQLCHPMESLLQDTSKVPDTHTTRDAIRTMGRLLLCLCEQDSARAEDFISELLVTQDQLNDPVTEVAPDLLRILIDIPDPSDRAFLIAQVWQLRLLKIYLIKGRMGLRVLSITSMTDVLTYSYEAYKDDLRHPVLLHLGDLMIREQIVEYILSVNSHPQIISRSKNVVGFLGVTNHWSQQQTEVCWDALCHAQDPHILAAIANMLREVAFFVDPEELCHFFRKIFHVQVKDLTQAIFDVFTGMVTNIIEGKSFRRTTFDWTTAESTAKPWNVCLRIIQDTAPCRDSSPLMIQLHESACDLLQRILARFAGLEGRELEQVFAECVSEIEKKSSKATGSVHALELLNIRKQWEALQLYRAKPETIRTIFEELGTFFERERHQGPYPQYEEALDHRVELIRFFIKHLPELMPVEFYSNIWDHTVGRYALDAGLRDRIWHKFASFNTEVPQNDFCKRLITLYVPSLEPQYFSRGLFDFVASYPFPPGNSGMDASNDDDKPSQIAGSDLLWRIIVDAPEGTIETDATELLASRYASIPVGSALKNLEDEHDTLVQKCCQTLMREYRTIRASEIGRPMDGGKEAILTEVDRKLAEHRLTRIVRFLNLLLEKIRANHRFSPRVYHNHHEVKHTVIAQKGTPIIITYNSGGAQDKNILPIGTENSLHELEARLCQATGFTQINLFFAGRRLNPPERSADTLLGALGVSSGGHMLVQKASSDGGVCQTLRPRNRGLSVFETALDDHFEELFSSMDSDDHVSEVVSTL